MQRQQLPALEYHVAHGCNLSCQQCSHYSNHRVASFFTDGICQRDKTANVLIISNDHDSPSRFLHGIQVLVNLRRLLYALFQIAMRTEPVRFAMDDSGSSLAWDSLKVLGAGNFEVSAFCFFHDRTCQRVVAVEFKSCRFWFEWELHFSI